jgi:hypothetical protein
MLNKILTAIFAVLILPFSITTANADTKSTLVILDTGLSTSEQMFSGKIINEVCFTQYNSCPNNQNFMEGTGSANIPKSWSDTNDVWKHGTGMASVAIQKNSNINIIPIRLYSMVMLKDKVTYGSINPTQDRVALALDWVLNNKDKYSIKAVSAPLGFYYAKSCNININIQNTIKKLNAANIAVIFSSGNNWDYQFTNEPSCIPEAISVAGLNPDGTIGQYSNLNQSVDFASTGTYNVLVPGGTFEKQIGTSVSAVSFGADWIKVFDTKPYLTYQQEYDLIKLTSTISKQGPLTKGKVAGLVTTLPVMNIDLATK